MQQNQPPQINQRFVRLGIALFLGLLAAAQFWSGNTWIGVTFLCVGLANMMLAIAGRTTITKIVAIPLVLIAVVSLGMYMMILFG